MRMEIIIIMSAKTPFFALFLKMDSVPNNCTINDYRHGHVRQMSERNIANIEKRAINVRRGFRKLADDM